ncbi:MAG: nucleotidyltransferase family protein, partial [Clostridia bacterium]|nr:nucleotidyltransferase family protein [Clostridia bacterium]
MTRALPKRPALTNEEETRCLRTAAYLAACAVNGDTADVSFVSDPDAVLAAAGRHGMSAIVAMALEKAGMRSERTASAIATALRREAVFEAAAEEVKQRLEAEGIWYVLLKGMKLKDLYPGRGMREMADCDILTDPNRMTDVRRIMEGLGFRTDHA